MQVPEPHIIVPDGMPETTWKAMHSCVHIMSTCMHIAIFGCKWNRGRFLNRQSIHISAKKDCFAGLLSRYSGNNSTFAYFLRTISILFQFTKNK